MEGVVSLRRHEGFQDLVGLFPRGCRWDEAQPLAHPVDVGIHREGGHVQGEKEEDGRRLGADAVEREQPSSGLPDRHLAQEVQAKFSPLLADPGERGLDPLRLLPTQPSHLDSLSDLVHGCVSHLLPRGEPLSELSEGPVAQGVVGVLAEDSRNQGGNGVPRLWARLAVDPDQAVVDLQGFGLGD